MKIVIGDDGPAVEIEYVDGFRGLARRLGEFAEEEAMQAEDILTQAEEANALEPVGRMFATETCRLPWRPHEPDTSQRVRTIRSRG